MRPKDRNYEDFMLSSLLNELKEFSDVKVEQSYRNAIIQKEETIETILKDKLNQKSEEVTCDLKRFHKKRRTPQKATRKARTEAKCSIQQNRRHY